MPTTRNTKSFGEIITDRREWRNAIGFALIVCVVAAALAMTIVNHSS